MISVLIATDSQTVFERVVSMLPSSIQPIHARSGQEAVAMSRAQQFDLVICDMQIGAMGGIAICSELKLDESVDTTIDTPVLMMLDRRADVFLARRSGAEGWIVKPLDAIRLKKAITSLSSGGTFHDATDQPVSVQ